MISVDQLPIALNLIQRKALHSFCPISFYP